MIKEKRRYLRFIGKNIRQYRQLKKMTQKELAEKVGSSSKYISRIELGRANPSIHLCYLIANALGTDMYSLYDDDYPF